MNKRTTWIAVTILAVVATLGVMLVKATPKSKPTSLEGNGNTSGGTPREDSLCVEVRKSRVVPVPLLLDAAAPPVEERPMTNEEEDELMAVADSSSRRREWRIAFGAERRDPAWTTRMEQELRRQAADILDERKLVIQELNCRETICRMYLQFEDQIDADAFKTAQRDPNLKYEFQSLDPEFKGEGFDRSNHTYEVMVQRPRPEGLGSSIPLDPPEDEGVVRAGDDNEIVVTANGA